jgi:hypothetical protein
VVSRRLFVQAALAGAAHATGVAVGFAATQGDRRMPRVIVCDVNETLLDVGALEPDFTEVFGDARVLQDWFATVLLYSEVATLAGPYTDFASIAGAALDMTASARGITMSSGNRTRILQGMLKLPAHTDVREGLQGMRDARLRLVTLPTRLQPPSSNSWPTLDSPHCSSARSRSIPFGGSSQPPKRTAPSPKRFEYRSINCASSPRMPGTSSEPFARDVPPRLWRDRGRCCTPSVRSLTSSVRIS